MNENPYANYLKYVRDVLGAQHIVQDSDLGRLKDHFFQPNPQLELEKKWDVIFVNCMFSEMESLFEESNQGLFQKMLSAMKLGTRSVLSVDTDVFTEKEILRRWYPFGLPELLVIFKSNPELAEDLRWVDDTAVVETYSPYFLQHQPDLKRITWNHLQRAMNHLARAQN